MPTLDLSIIGIARSRSVTELPASGVRGRSRNACDDWKLVMVMMLDDNEHHDTT